MNAEAILNKITEDAREAAARLKAEAEAKAAGLKEASHAEIEKSRKALLTQAEKDSAELEQRMLRMAELDDRKALLGRKRALIAEAFELARQKLANAPAEERRSFFLQQVAASANGTETLVIGAENDDWFDERFLNDVNAELQKQGLVGGLKLCHKRRAGCAGVILTGDGTEQLCTFDTMLEGARAEIEAQIAQVLFG